MVEISPIKSKIPNTSAKRSGTVHFGGAEQYAAKNAGEISSAIVEKMPRYVKFMDKLRCLKGEAGGIIINALGTGLVAPIFIAFNPISKADEKTKKYTAMRQPVSAVLAVATQAGLIIPLNRLYDYLTNNGILGKLPYLDKSNLKDEKYFLKEFKKLGNTRMSAQEYAESRMKEQTDAVIKQLSTDGTIIFKSGKKLTDEDMLKLINRTLDSYRTEIQTKIANIESKQIPQKIKRAQLLTDPNVVGRIETMCNALKDAQTGDGVNAVLEMWIKDENSDIATLAKEFKAKGSLQEIQSRAKNTLGKINLFRKNIAGCNFIADNSSYLAELLAGLKENPDNTKILNTLLEFADKHDNGHLVKRIVNNLSQTHDEALKQKIIQRSLDRISKLKELVGNREGIIELYQKAWYSDEIDVLKTQLDAIDAIKVDKNCKDIKGKLSFLSKKIETFNKKDFLADMVEMWKKITDSRIKGYKQVTNILFGLFITLPISCHALNWIYPRFMDIFFPSLSKNSKSDAPEEKAKLKEGK